jgi:hypothetical protein
LIPSKLVVDRLVGHRRGAPAATNRERSQHKKEVKWTSPHGTRPRCPFSQARMIEVTEAGKVIHKTEHLPAPRLRQAGNALGRFPESGHGELRAGPSRYFQVLQPSGSSFTVCPPNGRGDPRHLRRRKRRQGQAPALTGRVGPSSAVNRAVGGVGRFCLRWGSRWLGLSRPLGAL